MLPCHSGGPRLPIGRAWRQQLRRHQKCLDIIVWLTKRHHHEKVPICWTLHGEGCLAYLFCEASVSSGNHLLLSVFKLYEPLFTLRPVGGVECQNSDHQMPWIASRISSFLCYSFEVSSPTQIALLSQYFYRTQVSGV